MELEKTAADAWKYQVGSKNKLLTDKKIEELKNLKSKEQKWDVVVRAARWATEPKGRDSGRRVIVPVVKQHQALDLFFPNESPIIS